MVEVIKHGDTVHTYKCSECGCIFIADKTEEEIMSTGFNLLHCPECEYPVLDHDIIDNQEITNDKLFEKVNVPSSWKVGDHDKKYEATHTSATTDNCIKRYKK